MIMKQDKTVALIYRKLQTSEFDIQVVNKSPFSFDCRLIRSFVVTHNSKLNKTGKTS